MNYLNYKFIIIACVSKGLKGLVQLNSAQVVYRMGISGFPRSKKMNKTIFPIGIARWSTWHGRFSQIFFFFFKIFTFGPPKGSLPEENPKENVSKKNFWKKTTMPCRSAHNANRKNGLVHFFTPWEPRNPHPVYNLGCSWTSPFKVYYLWLKKFDTKIFKNKKIKSKLKGLDQLYPSLFTGWGFLGSQGVKK